jgi:hypothetical protein
MLAQTGSPTRANTTPQIVGIFQTTMTAHTGDGVDAVLCRAGTAEVYRSGVPCFSAVVAVSTGAADIRISRVSNVKSISPVKVLSCRYVVVVRLLEGGMTLGALTLVTDVV